MPFVRHLSLCLLACGACSVDEPRPGTQIGVEEEGPGCEVVSEEVVSGTTQPPGFSTTVDASLQALMGSFVGSPLDEDEQPMSGEVVLTLAALEGEVRLTRTEPVDGSSGTGTGTDMGWSCVDWVAKPAHLMVEAEGLPRFDSEVLLQVDETGAGWVHVDGDAGFDGPLPAPTTFDLDAVDEAHVSLSLSGTGEAWWTTVSWAAEVHDGLGEDGGHSLLREPLLMAELRAQ